MPTIPVPKPPETTATNSGTLPATGLSDQVLVVHGTVRLTDSRPLAGVIVTAFNQDLRRQEVLGEASTGPDGQYHINYTAAQYPEVGAADLVFKLAFREKPLTKFTATDESGNLLETLEGLDDSRSPTTVFIKFDGLPDQTVDFDVSPDEFGLLSEYERLVSELEPLLVNVTIPGNANPSTIDRLADLQTRDIDFLVGETGEQRPKLEALVTAAVLEKQAGAAMDIPAAAFYGLAREGLPLDLGALATFTVQNLQAALTQALKDNIIPAALSSILAPLLRSLFQFIVQHTLQNVPTAGAHSFGELLGTAALAADQQQALLSLAMNHDGTPAEFWQQLRAQPGFQGGVVDKLQLTVQLGLLTQNHVPLIQQLQQLKVTSPHDLVNFDATAWLNLVNKSVNGRPVGVPPGVPGATPQEQALNYVNGLMATLQTALPTATMAQIATRARNLPAQAAVATFFANSLDFDIRSTHVDAYAAQNAATAFRGISDTDKPEVLRQVKRLQRVFQLSLDANTASALQDVGLDSAHAIANTPRNSFLQQHSLALGGEQQADLIYQRAQRINARTLLIYAHVNEQLNGTHPAAIQDGSTQVQQQDLIKRFANYNEQLNGIHLAAIQDGSTQAPQDLIKRFPNFTELFGSLDLCQCAQCRSVLSPAAYLVDLLEFLRKSKANDNGKTPLDMLLLRRPDLQYLPLTCENTNTALPYIDLVNEVLEGYIALQGHLDKSIAYDTGDATSAELDANPQHTNNTAYLWLAGYVLPHGVYPATLPFNQPVTEARAYLGNLGTSRYEVMNTFQRQPHSPLAMRGLAAEYLAISREEFQVITGADFDPNGPVPQRPLRAFYGPDLPVANWEHLLAAVPQFLLRTGIAYTDLVQLVTTRFINPNYPQGQALDTFLAIPISFKTLTALVKSNFASPDPAVQARVTEALGSWQALIDWSNANYQTVSQVIVLDAPDGSCDVASTTLVHLDGSPVTDTEFSNLHRFIRLWRKLGWSMADLDCALTALAASDITPDVVIQLAQIQQLQRGLSLQNLQMALSLWAPINTRGNDALYNKLFLSKARQVDAAFVPQKDGSVLTDNSQTIGGDSGHVPALLAALRISAADLEAIRDDAGLSADAAPLTLANVSLLYRYALLAQSLRLRIGDFLALKALTGLNPFTAPAQTILFQAAATTVQQSGFKVAQLTYLFRHVTVPPGSLAPQATQLQLLAQTLRKGLDQITQDNAPAPDPTGDLCRTKLMLLFDSATVETTIGMNNEVLSIVVDEEFVRRRPLSWSHPRTPFP